MMVTMGFSLRTITLDNALLYPDFLKTLDDKATWLEIYAKHLRVDGEIKARTKAYHEFMAMEKA